MPDGNAQERSEFRSAQDGLMLHARIVGAAQPGRLPVLFLPGLTRNHRDFSALAQMFARDPVAPRQVIALDYRGRGLSARDPVWQNYNTLTEANDVLHMLAALGIEKVDVIATSRGGLIVHVLSAMRPGVMGAVVLNDVGPEIGGAGLAAIRTGLGAMPKPANWTEAERWMVQAYQKSFPALSQADFQRMTRALFKDGEDGRPVADFDPALVNTLQAIDFNAPLPTLWPQFAGLRGHRVMVLRGENSLLLTPETVEKMRQAHPRLVAHTVPGQGHAPMLEAGDLPRRLMRFLNA
jgi:pimeloyl-ACP methyl ester carboxylesterase